MQRVIYQELMRRRLGIHNTAIGFQSLKANYSEAYNTSVGSETLKSHNGGGTGKNTAVGA